VTETFFGLSLLPCDEIAESFTGDIMFDMPDDIRQFADYVVDNFDAADSDFPPTPWAHAPDLIPGAESYHGHLNAEFNPPRPNIYIFVEVLLRQQAATHVTVSSLSKSRTIPRSIRKNPLGYANILQIILPVSIRLSSTCWLSKYRTVIVVCRLSDGI